MSMAVADNKTLRNALSLGDLAELDFDAIEEDDYNDGDYGAVGETAPLSRNEQFFG